MMTKPACVCRDPAQGARELKIRRLTSGKKNLHKGDTFKVLLLFLELQTYFIPTSNRCPGFTLLNVTRLSGVFFKWQRRVLISSPWTSEMWPSAAVCGPLASLLTVGGLWITARYYSWHGQIWTLLLDSSRDRLTGEELFRGNAELDLFVYLVGHVRPLCSCPAGAQASLQGHPFHVFRHFQQLQNIDGTSWKWKTKKQMLCLVVYTEMKKLLKGLRPNQMAATCF